MKSKVSSISEGVRQTLKLSEPILWGSETISELHIRKPKAKDFRNMPMDPKTGDILSMAGKLAGQPDAVIDELGMEDMKALMEMVGNFINAGPAIGSKL